MSAVSRRMIQYREHPDFLRLLRHRGPLKVDTAFTARRRQRTRHSRLTAPVTAVGARVFPKRLAVWIGASLVQILVAARTVLIRPTVVSFHSEGEQGSERRETGADNTWIDSIFSMDAPRNSAGEITYLCRSRRWTRYMD